MQHILKVYTFDRCNESAQVEPFVVCFHFYTHLFIEKEVRNNFITTCFIVCILLFALLHNLLALPCKTGILC